MKTMRLLTITVSLFTFCALAGGTHPTFGLVSVANAEVEGPAFKLKKPAKLHVAASGPSKVSEIVMKNAVCIWLDKKDVWVQVRMKKTGHIGWIHHSYLAPASMATGTK